MFLSQRVTCVHIVMTGSTEDQRFASPGSRDLHPLRLFPAIVHVQVFKRPDMMDFNVPCKVGRQADFTHLRQESFFRLIIGCSSSA